MSSFSASRVSSVLGTSVPVAPITNASSIVATASPQVASTSSISKPTPIVKLANPVPLLTQDVNTGTTTLYTNISKNSELLVVSPTGAYFGTGNVAGRLPLQPKEANGTSRNVVAFDSNVVLVNPATVTSARQQLQFDPSNGRIVVLQSSQRFKTEIKPLEESKEVDVDKLFNLLEAKSYVDIRYKDAPTASKVRELGFIAEDVEKDFPELVNYDENKQVVGIKYDTISVLAVNKIKHLQKQLDSLSARLDKLETK